MGLIQHRGWAASGSVAAQDNVLALRTLSFDELRARFQRLYRKPAPPGLTRDLITRLVAQRLQEKTLGKLSPEVARQLDRLSRGETPKRRLRAGSVLVREHDGVMHEVMIVPDGYLWNGETHASLSGIARTITGTSWNGPRFFGLRQTAREPAAITGRGK